MSTRIRAQLEYIKEQLEDAQQRHAEVDFALKYSRQQLDDIQRQDSSIATLNTILEQVNRLEDLDTIQLLWGESCTDSQAEQKRRRLETSLKDYDTRVSSAQHRITGLLDERTRLNREINTLLLQRDNLQDELNRIPVELQLQPEPAPPVSTQVILPWSNKHNDAVRLRIIMMAALITSVLLGYIVPRWEIPEPERIEYIEIPERLATLIVKKAPPPPPKQEAEPEEAEAADKAEDEPAAAEEKSDDARTVAEKTGLLAFSKDLADIRNVAEDIKLGSQARIMTTAATQPRRPATRSVITAPVVLEGTGTTTKVRRTEIVTGENTLKKVEFTHIESTEVAALDRKQFGSDTKARRSDEEIQVVFDRYKEALYRIYSRELRKNSFLKGKLVLQLTIEADGKVSKVKVNSSDLNSAELEKKIVARVMRFNFGAKKGANAMTILYPINFLPAS